LQVTQAVTNHAPHLLAVADDAAGDLCVQVVGRCVARLSPDVSHVESRDDTRQGVDSVNEPSGGEWQECDGGGGGVQDAVRSCGGGDRTGQVGHS
jgi:hypothetical protein